MPDADWWAKVARDLPGGEDQPGEPNVAAVTDNELLEVESEARSFLVPGGRAEPDGPFIVTAAMTRFAAGSGGIKKPHPRPFRGVSKWGEICPSRDTQDYLAFFGLGQAKECQNTWPRKS